MTWSQAAQLGFIQRICILRNRNMVETRPFAHREPVCMYTVRKREQKGTKKWTCISYRKGLRGFPTTGSGNKLRPNC